MESLSSLVDFGVFIPVPKSGATAITEGTGYYYRFGNIVVVSYLYWGMQLTGADSSQFTLNLPYKNETMRAFGMLGYHNFGASQVPLMLSSMQGTPDRVGLQKQTGQGDSILHGTDLTGSYTWQGTIIYYTLGEKLV